MQASGDLEVRSCCKGQQKISLRMFVIISTRCMKGKFRARINLKLEGVENVVDPKSIPIKVWFVGKVCKMRKKLGICWWSVWIQLT